MKLDAKSINVESLLVGECSYIIPDYQRPYSWTKIQIEELLEDIEIGMDSETNHFFGTVMLNVGRKESEKIIEVIDGQQRMTTIIIILYILLEEYGSQRFIGQANVAARKGKLKEKLAYTDDDGEIIADKLTLGEDNKEFFKEYIISSFESSPGTKESIIKRFKTNKKYKINKPIIDAYSLIKEYFNKKISTESDDSAFKILKEYQEFILRKLDIVKIEIEDDSDAFLIFETLNDRGLALSSVDLIKNKLFKNCVKSNDFNKIQSKWTEMINTLEEGNEVKKYIRHYWMSKYDYVTTQNLFKVTRNYVKNDYEKSKQFVDELYEYSKYYASIKNPYSGLFNNKKLKKALDDMNQLNFDLTHPIIIAAFRSYKDEDQIYKVVKLCLNFLIRYISIMKEKPSQIEKKICAVAKTLTVENLERLFNELAPDSKFKNKVEQITVNYKSFFTYYMLIEYEASLHKNEPWKTTGRDSITIEHILPQCVKDNCVYGAKWIEAFGSIENCDLYENRLGNLTLLGNVGQGKASKKDFESKKVVYKKNTDMFSTKELLTYNSWTAEKIEERQKKMAEAYIDLFTLRTDRI